MRPQLNLFACHSERIAKLVSLGFLFREPRFLEAKSGALSDVA